MNNEEFLSEAEYLKQRLLQGNFTPYTTVHMSESSKKLLQKWVHKGIVAKVQRQMWSGAGNKYDYYLVKDVDTRESPMQIELTHRDYVSKDLLHYRHNPVELKRHFKKKKSYVSKRLYKEIKPTIVRL